MQSCVCNILPSQQNVWIKDISDSGVSDEAKVIGLFGTEETSRLSLSISLGWRNELKEVAREAFDEASETGWNGEDALPITLQTLCSTREIIDSLPENIQLPEVMPDIDGGILLDWFKNKDNIITISIKGGRFVYAALFNGHKQHGSEMVSDYLPEEITRILITYFRKQ